MLVKCVEHNIDLFGAVYQTVYKKYMSLADLAHWSDVHPESDYAKVIECFDPKCTLYPGYIVRGKL